MENVKKHRYITLNYLTSKPNYRTAKYCKIFYKISISNRNKKNPQILRNSSVYLGLSILESSKILMYEFWYHYVKSKYGEKAKLCYMDTGIVYIKADEFI